MLHPHNTTNFSRSDIQNIFEQFHLLLKQGIIALGAVGNYGHNLPSFHVQNMESMNYIEKIECIIKKQNGMILSSDLKRHNIPRIYLSMMVEEDKLDRVDRGVYVLPDVIEDEMYIMQKIL